MKSLIVIIMDESASMTSRKMEVISGFNNFLYNQKGIKADTASAILVKFNTVVNIQNDCTPIDDFPPMTTISYKPSGSTALFDAIWQGIRLGEKKETEFDRVLCSIMTDGEENSSRLITLAGIRYIMKAKENEGKWTFIYIGDKPERWALETGIRAGNAIAYKHDDPKSNFRMIQMATTSYRSTPEIRPQQLMRYDPNVPTSPPRRVFASENHFVARPLTEEEKRSRRFERYLPRVSEFGSVPNVPSRPPRRVLVPRNRFVVSELTEEEQRGSVRSRYLPSLPESEAHRRV